MHPPPVRVPIAGAVRSGVARRVNRARLAGRVLGRGGGVELGEHEPLLLAQRDGLALRQRLNLRLRHVAEERVEELLGHRDFPRARAPAEKSIERDGQVVVNLLRDHLLPLLDELCLLRLDFAL